MATGSLGDAFGDLIVELGNRGMLTPRQRSTATRVYHITDVKHAASILASGAVLSRRAASSSGLLVQETGNLGIIDDQADWIADCARLYFRPRTPSLFHSEGIRPAGKYGSGECPVPVCFEFDARRVLNLPGVRFSNGNTIEWNRLRIGSSASDLHILDLPDIYSDGPMTDTPGIKDLMTFRRHAEVMIPDRLPTELLVSVATRTFAERETLLSLVRAREDSEASRPALADLVRVDPSRFYNYWASVNRCAVDDGELVFEIARGTCAPEGLSYVPRFNLHLEVETSLGTIVDQGAITVGKRNLELRWMIESLHAPDVLTARLYMDHQLAFDGAPQPFFTDAPFD